MHRGEGEESSSGKRGGGGGVEESSNGKRGRRCNRNRTGESRAKVVKQKTKGIDEKRGEEGRKGRGERLKERG